MPLPREGVRLASRRLARVLVASAVAGGLALETGAQQPVLVSAAPCGSRAAGQPPVEPAPSRASDVVVLAFRSWQTPGEPSFLGEGFAAGVAGRLHAAGSVDVHSTTPLDVPEPASAIEVQRLGRATGARFVLAGEVLRTGEDARVRVRVYRAGDGVRIGSTEYAVPAAQLAGLEAQAAAAGAAHVARRRLTSDELGALGRQRMSSAAAYDRLLLGRTLAAQRTPASLLRAAAMFGDAARLDPALAEAHARRALAYAELVERGWMGGTPQLLLRDAHAHAAQATKSEPALALGWAALARIAALEPGLVAVHASQAAARALALAPRDAEVTYSAARAYWNGGNTAAAEPLLVRASSLDGQRSAPLVDLADARAGRRDWVGACAALNRAVAVDGRDPYAYALRALVRLRLGETRDAWADAETVTLLGRTADGLAASAVVDAFAGDTAQVRAKLRPYLLVRGTQAPALSAWEGRLLGLAAATARRPADAIELVARVRPRGGLLRTMLLDSGFDGLRHDAQWPGLGGPAGTPSPGLGRAGPAPTPATRPASRRSEPGAR
jgi:TolB-like protein